MEERRDNTLIKACRYFLIVYVFSFIGWAFEVSQSIIIYHSFADRGFLSSPICPIYGFTIIFIYFVAGTPLEPGGLLKNVRPLTCVVIMYFFVAFLFPTFMEYIIGVSFEKMFNVRLWDYSYLPYNNSGYISLGISLGWSLLITLVMRFIFPPIKKLIYMVPNKFSLILSLVLFFSITVDFIYNVCLLLLK